MSLTIRPLTTIAEYQACEALQRRVWQMTEDLNVVPLHILLSVQQNGGQVLGAFDGDALVGFLFGFPGLTAEGRIKHCSHMMGITPEYQSRGVGYELKVAQREAALRQRMDLVTWTYDPLEGRNAALNIHKLGAVCRVYAPDIYGDMAIGLYAGVPTDRFEVEWWITSGRVRGRLAGEMLAPSAAGFVLANRTGHTPDGLLTPGDLVLDADAPEIRVQIPDSFQAIKAIDIALAREWRAATRQLFQTYLTAGYTVVDFFRHQAARERGSFYSLRVQAQDVCSEGWECLRTAVRNGKHGQEGAANAH